MISGVDLIGATVEAAMGNNNIDFNYAKKEYYYATHNLHTSKNGVFKDVVFDEEIEKRIIKKVIYKEKGDPVQFFDGANKAIGIVFLKFDSIEEMLDMMDHSDNWIQIIVN
jgi:hypothetical protein